MIIIIRRVFVQNNIRFSITRLNIIFVIFLINRHAKNFEKQHIKVVKHILRYFQETKIKDIIFDKNNLIIQNYFDFDWTRFKKDRKFTFDYVFMLNDDFISWCFKRQSIVALFFTKIEYIILTVVVKKAIWLRLLITELDIQNTTSIINVIKKNRNNT